MRKGSGVDAVESYHRIPRPTYQKLAKLKEETKSRSINKTLCSILDEYFQMKEAQKKEA